MHTGSCAGEGQLLLLQSAAQATACFVMYSGPPNSVVIVPGSLQDGITTQIPLIGVARGNALADDTAWETQGKAEAAALHAAIRGAGRLWGPFEVQWA